MSPTRCRAERVLLLACAAAALAAAPAAAQRPLEAPSSEPEPPAIEVRELGDIDPLEVPAGGGLGGDVWSSGEAESLRAAFLALPGAARGGWTSAAAARLAAEALTSAGDAPRNARLVPELASLRAERVLGLGRADTAYALLERTPRINESAALSKVFAEAAFALGRNAEACRSADALISGREAPYWLRARAACLALNGSERAAELTAELARSAEPDERFDSLLDEVILGRAVGEPAAPRTGLDLALAREARPAAFIETAEDAPAYVQRAAASAGPEIRLPNAVEAALEAAIELDGPARAAALGALVQQDIDRKIAARALALRLADAAAQGAFADAAAAYGPEIALLPLDGETLEHGVRFTLAAALAGDTETAQRWRRALEDGPPAPLPGFDESEPFAGYNADAVLSGDGPAGLAPESLPEAPDAPWTAPPPGVLVALDFAIDIARGDVDRPAFIALMAARIEGGAPERLRQAALLAGAGAAQPASLRLALQPQPAPDPAGDAAEPAPADAADTQAPAEAPPSPRTVAPAKALLAGAAGAKGEAVLLAAALIEQTPEDPAAYAAAGAALHAAGLRELALRMALELVAEETA